MKAGRELPDLQPEKARGNLSKVESSQGQVEVRCPSPGKTPEPVSAVLWRRREEKAEPCDC